MTEKDFRRKSLMIKPSHKSVFLPGLNVMCVFSMLSCITSTTWASLPIVLAISGGPAWYNAGQTQIFYLQPGFENAYVARKSNQTLASAEWFAGFSKHLITNIDGQFGVAVVTTSNASLQGQIWETADPLFDNFTYKYNIQHTHVALKSKLTSEIWNNNLKPYVSGSVGLAWNQSMQFSMQPLLPQIVPEPPFTDYTKTAFTYTVGAGVAKEFTKHWLLGVGYELADWGHSQLGRATGQTMNSGLTLNHFYTNQLQFSISYLA